MFVVAACPRFKIEPLTGVAYVGLGQRRYVIHDRPEQLLREQLALVVGVWRMPLLHTAGATTVARLD